MISLPGRVSGSLSVLTWNRQVCYIVVVMESVENIISAQVPGRQVIRSAAVLVMVLLFTVVAAAGVVSEPCGAGCDHHYVPVKKCCAEPESAQTAEMGHDCCSAQTTPACEYMQECDPIAETAARYTSLAPSVHSDYGLPALPSEPLSVARTDYGESILHGKSPPDSGLPPLFILHCTFLN